MTGNRSDPLLKEWKVEEIAPFTGWDFSRLSGRLIHDTPPWSYEKIARELLSSASSALDLGTGGGERLLEFKDVFPARTTATEGYRRNFVLARKRLRPFDIEVVECNDSLRQVLPFKSEEFDLVINRHTAFNVSEVERVLTPGGVFLTQQIDGSNLADLSAAFDDEQPWPFITLEFFLEKIRATNLVVEMAEEWTGQTIFKDVGAIVYYLKAVPWTVPQGFSVERHDVHLRKLQRRLEQEGELVFQQKLLMIKARRAE